MERSYSWHNQLRREYIHEHSVCCRSRKGADSASSRSKVHQRGISRNCIDSNHDRLSAVRTHSGVGQCSMFGQRAGTVTRVGSKLSPIVGMSPLALDGDYSRTQDSIVLGLSLAGRIRSYRLESDTEPPLHPCTDKKCSRPSASFQWDLSKHPVPGMEDSWGESVP